jgi:3-oxoacyl-(acyl-carrier-protein) synthase
MSIIINSLEILDANGTSLTDSITNFKKGRQANYQRYLMDPITDLVKFDVPMSNDQIDQELSKFDFKEYYMPRTVKMATLVALRATAGLNLPKNTVVIGSTLEGSSEVKGDIWNSFTNKKSKASPRACATGTASTVCTTVSRTLGISGPSFMITQACSGFITALDLAAKFLNSDTAEVVLVVSVDSTQPLNGYMFRSMGVYTSEIVRPLDANRSGMALGEGAACYVVTKEKNAQRQVARIKKISLYNDFYNLIAPHPDGLAGTHLLTDLGAYDTKVDSVNAHATATKVGDDIELSSIEKLPYTTDVFGLKGSVGHTLSSSAGIEMAYSITGLNEGWVPYTSNVETPLPTKHNIVRDTILEKQTDNFIKLSFGFGGVSAGILVEKINK